MLTVTSALNLLSPHPNDLSVVLTPISKFLLKFIKFGYGRGSDHASKDIRTGYLNREQGIEMVRKYDSVVSSDLYHWLDYVGMKEEEFWSVADSFRDARVWWIKDGQWWKENIWGGASAYGDVHLTAEQQKKYIRG